MEEMLISGGQLKTALCCLSTYAKGTTPDWVSNLAL
jgi:hypothetical protein